MSQLETILHEQGLRTTLARKTVFETLEKAAEPLSIKAVTERCPTIDRVSVYRCLDVFVAIGITEIIHVGWKKRYELAGPFRAHHHHLQCNNCHRVIELDSPELERLISQTAAEHQFMPLTHHFEISGLCSTCQNSEK